MLDHLGVAQADVVAHSWGASVALALAADRPERVRRVALYDAWALDAQVPPLPCRARWAATSTGAPMPGCRCTATCARAPRRTATWHHLAPAPSHSPRSRISYLHCQAFVAPSALSTNTLPIFWIPADPLPWFSIIT
ncbi:MAG: alpha/beta fold hydrolase [Myxococcales bacterium]|nr:alpha/beta fold hydrolase [Myxococcales bacterium]